MATLIGGYWFDAETAASFHRFLLVLCVLVTSFSAFVTSAKFSAGDRLLVSWLLLGAGYFLAAVRHGVRLYADLDPSIGLPSGVSTALTIVEIAFIAIALLQFVRFNASRISSRYLIASAVLWLLFFLLRSMPGPIAEAFRLAAVLFALIATKAERRALRGA